MGRTPARQRAGAPGAGSSATRSAAATTGPEPTTGPQPTTGPVPVVGRREPCPCGSGKRYKACHGRAARVAVATPVRRPFAGLPGECDWVALREIVPAATASVRTTADTGARDVMVATVLPMAWPGLRRADGSLALGLQVTSASTDPSRDLATVLLAALEMTEPGPVPTGAAAAVAGAEDGTAPRLQDVLDLDVPFEVTVHEGFDFWLQDGQERSAEVSASLERANAAVVPTVRLNGVEAAYWCQIGSRRHLRWVLPHEEEALLDALARLHAAGASALGEGSRYVGAFRAHGLAVPVWDLPDDAGAADVEEPARAFARRLEEALAEEGPLTPEQRRARAGVVSRQVTLR